MQLCDEKTVLFRPIQKEALNSKNVVEKYGRQDVKATQALIDDQLKDLKLPRNKNLIATIKMMNEFLLSLIEMERNGIYVDANTLEEVEKEFIKELN